MADKEYEVGFAKPPKSKQFQKGKSGNSKGRPKGSKNTLKILDELLSQKVLITQDGRQIKISKKTAILLQSVNSAVRGDIKSLQVILPHMLAADQIAEASNANAKSLSAQDKQIIQQFINQNKKV